MFETASDITAMIGYNALPAQTSQAWVSVGNDSSTWIQGTANSINVGDVLLFVAAKKGVATHTGPCEKHTVVAVNLDSTNGITQLIWDGTLSASFPAGTTAAQLCLYVFRKKAALYGVQAPSTGTFVAGTLSKIPGAPAAPGDDWVFDNYKNGDDALNLDAVYTGLLAAPGTTQWALFTSSKVGDAILRVTGATESNPNRYTITNKTSRLNVKLGEVPSGGSSGSALNDALAAYEKDTRNVTVYIQTAPLALADLPVVAWTGTYPLQSGMVAPVGGSSIAIVGGQQIAVGQPIGVSGKRARVQVLPGAGASFAPAKSSASLTVSDNQVFLIDAYPPTASSSSSGISLWAVITVSGVSGTLTLNDNYALLVPSVKGDPVTSEASDISTTTVDGDITTLALGGALIRLYDANTVAINANAVTASNGETVQELLGSGDATNAALTFTLKQSPLTYVSSTGANGTQSTLQVWINNIQWHEVPNLLSSGPADRVFVTRVNQTGFTVVQFGDGVNGARTPTGQMNIRAVYRKGIGSAGMVAAGQLSQPLDRPQGLRTVTNPSAAAGGADPATADDARASAPLPTLTIGRVVSLEDYQNYALNFGGIAKATASWTFFNGTRGVFLTIAGANGATFEPTDTVVLNLIASLQKYGNPYVPLYVASYDPVLFQVAANVKIDDDNYDPTLVLAQVWQNLVAAFAFAQCQLAQNVAASDIIEIVQQTPGVIALQLTALFLSGSPTTTLPAQLCAAGALPPQGAQMLLLDPACQNAIGAWT